MKIENFFNIIKSPFLVDDTTVGFLVPADGDLKKIVRIEFANEGDPSWLCGFVNDLNLDDDGWMMVAPYGDHPSDALIFGEDGRFKKQKAIQRITRVNAAKMVAEFHNSRAGAKKFLVGKMIFDGHPDVPGLEKRYPDKSPKGLYADFEAREDGLYGKPVFNNDGEKLITARKFGAVSARFGESERDGEKNGVPVYCPTQIISVGLTNNPHLPVHFFNSDDTLAEADADAENKNNQINKMKKKLIALCAQLGIQFANEKADDAATEAALDQVQAKVTEFANEKQTLTAKVTALETEKTKLTADAATAATAATTSAAAIAAAQTEFANERTARISDMIAHGLTSGTITGAEEATWRNRLAVPAQFVNESTAFKALKPTVKTTSIIVKHGGKDHQVDMANTRERTQFVNEVLSGIATEEKLNPVKDSRKIMLLAQQRHPALFKDIPHVAIKMPHGK